jgi:HlyD family secretion protein
MKRIYWIAIIAVVVLIIVAIIGKQMGFIGGEAHIKVSVAEVERGNITETVTANGKIYPSLEVKISPDVAGEIIELYVKEGDSVYAGMELARIKPDNYIAALDRAVAALNTAKANHLNALAQLTQLQVQFENAQKTFNRNKSLFEQKVISAADFDQIETQYKAALANYNGMQQQVDAAKFSVESAQAGVKQARDDLSKTSIIAPVGGIISKMNVEKGERVVATFQMAGTEMFRISNLFAMEARVDVSENDVLRVSLGDTAEITVDAYNDKKFIGVVSEIANSANTSTTNVSTDQVTNFRIKILILSDSYIDMIDTESKKFPLLPGMSCSVDIKTRKVEQVIKVPIQSVTTKVNTDEKTDAKKVQPIVFVLQSGNKISAVEVGTGIQDDEYIEIKSGLEEKQQIVDAPYSAISKILKDGMNVQVVKKDELFKESESK